jgi:SAM-dependent methyltransferase
MLDSLHRRPRGRTLAPALALLTRGRVPAPPPPPAPSPEPEPGSDSRLLDALRAFRAPDYPERVGPATRELLDRIDDADARAVVARLEPQLRSIFDAASHVNRQYLTLVFGLFYGIEPVLRKTGLPAAMPSDDVHAMARGALAAGGDFWLADLVVEAALRCGAEFSRAMRVLDFGCSSARHLRVMRAWRPDVHWMGCDPNAGAIAWASEHLPGIEFFVSPQEPPLDLAPESLDIVFAISVWSHFGARTGRAWLAEMHRLLKPGGLLILTTQGVGSLAYYLRLEAIREIDAVHAVEDLLSRGHHYVKAFGEGGDWGVEHPEWGMAYMTLEWLARATLPGWSVALFETTRVDTNQDLVVLQRRASTMT